MVARGDRVQRSNRRCSTSGSSRSLTMQRLALLYLLSNFGALSLIFSPSGTPGRTEGAGLAREGKDNAGTLDWQI